MFKKILIANRGEIAARIHRACRDMGIQTVAIHSTEDSNAIHVKMANESVCIGPKSPKDSYLNMAAILSAAEITNAEAIHPGYGFLSENAKFAKMVEESGFVFIGPKSEHIELMGDKITALDYVKKLGLPTIPGSDGTIADSKAAAKIADKIGYPVIVKASAGGGGRGMSIAFNEKELHEGFKVAQTEAKAGFGDDRMFVEKFLEGPKHIEIQVLADKLGNAIHLGERDCSLQRRHQKVLEEAPSSVLSQQQREDLGSLCVKACETMGYFGVGTFEFLFENDKFYFIEMNTRIQVEHPVTELVTGVDLIAEQIKVAYGEELTLKGRNLAPRGHSIECRINAEDPKTFMPSPGKVTDYFTPGGLGIRVDSALYPDYVVPVFYDSMVAKLIVHGANREQAIARMKRALEEFVIGGIKTNIPLHREIIKSEEFISGRYSIKDLETIIKNFS
ncbi:MAG: acetyl-CoA carboxylase biotin carboxylase subunit [Proteobacteria bacterium]|nr:acetyl-CoA carboxylase biotin carboxylase subunit [Pseudomonadota bacterium]